MGASHCLQVHLSQVIFSLPVVYLFIKKILMVKGLWSSISPIIENIVKITSHHEFVTFVPLSSRSIKSQREASCHFYFDAFGRGLPPRLWASSIFLLILLIINFTRKGPAMSFRFCLFVWFGLIYLHDYVPGFWNPSWLKASLGNHSWSDISILLFFNILTLSSVFPLFSLFFFTCFYMNSKIFPNFGLCVTDSVLYGFIAIIQPSVEPS